jgi:hypothetical protein
MWTLALLAFAATALASIALIKATPRRSYRSRPVSEIELEGQHTLAAAICCLAAGQHSTDVANQEQIAAVFYNLAMTGFIGVGDNPAVKAFVDDLFKRALKK